MKIDYMEICNSGDNREMNKKANRQHNWIEKDSEQCGPHSQPSEWGEDD